MPTNEEGEFELVLGNKQLLSVFFLVVLLLGVFFSMGYIVGRNTAPAASQIASTRAGGGTLTVEPPLAATPVPADLSRPSPVGQTTEALPPAPRETAGPAKPEAKPEPRSEPRPVREVAKVEPKPEPQPVRQPARVEPKPEPVPVRAESKPAAKGSLYLQVAAVREKDATILREVLGKRGFQTATEEVPEKNLVRVLVGPFKDADGLSQAREKLADFKPIQRKM